jgi:hypothetical protein
MLIARGWVVMVLVAGIVCGAQTKKSPSIDFDAPIVRTASPETRPCGDTDFALMAEAEREGILTDYGYGGSIPWTCEAAIVPWLKTAQIVRLRATEGDDDFLRLTLLRATLHARIWLIPIEHGMVGFAHVVDDPHNLAAFNDLLRVAKLKPREDQILEISNLYQFAVGMEMYIDPQRAPKTLREASLLNDVESYTSEGNGYLDVTHRERLGDSWSHEYMVWEFRYETTGDYFRLIDVARQTLADHEKEN